MAGISTVQAAPQRLPLAGFGAVAVDEAHRHVFVSGGAASNTIVVADFDGEVVKKIDGESGATGLALSADGKTLYAALATGDAVSAIDTSTLAETARYATPPHTCPTSLARAGESLWFGYGCPGEGKGGLGKVDTAAKPPSVSLDQQGDVLLQGAPLVAATAADAGPLVVGAAHASTSTTTVYSVVNGVPHTGPSRAVAGSDLADQSLSPDGALLFTASGSRREVAAFATADLSSRGAYPVGDAAAAVALSPDGGYVAAGSAAVRHTVRVYKLGATTPVRVAGLDGDVVAPGGLAWCAKQRLLFAVSHHGANSRPALRVIHDPTG